MSLDEKQLSRINIITAFLGEQGEKSFPDAIDRLLDLAEWSIKETLNGNAIVSVTQQQCEALELLGHHFKWPDALVAARKAHNNTFQGEE